MDAPLRGSRPGLRVVPVKQLPAAPVADDLRIARRRMRHLAPWKVTAVPMIRSAQGKVSEPTTPGNQFANKWALQVLAMHMSQATPKHGRR
jgi:hypothetical protein